MITTKILVVEDEFITATDIGDRLRGLGYEVPAVADSGEEAIRMAGELRPALVLMDIGLSGKMSGIEAAREIRDRFGIPVVFLTAHADEATFWSSLASEPGGYLVKPVETHDLKFSIEMALHRHGETGRTDRVAATDAQPEGPKGRRLAKMAALICIALLVILFFALPAIRDATAPGKDAQVEKNRHIVREIARDYYRTHTYLGVQNGQPVDIYVCIDMAKDVWNMIKTRGINAVVRVGNVSHDITTIDDIDHAWVVAEVGPMEWLAVETTGGFVVTREENPRYYAGMQFENPADMKEYLCGRGYCWSDTCIDNKCRACPPGYLLGTDLQCHVQCGSTYCTGDSVCVNNECTSCENGYVVGKDNQCHPACIDAQHYCLPGYVCGTDNKCHPAAGNRT